MIDVNVSTYKINDNSFEKQNTVSNTVSKSVCSKAGKRFLRHKSRACEAVFDALCYCIPESDWQLEQTPVCYASNETLCRLTNLSPRSLQRHLKTLEEHGLIQRRAGIRNKRYVDRVTGEKLGIDLSPLRDNLDLILVDGQQMAEQARIRDRTTHKLRALKRRLLSNLSKSISENEAPNRQADFEELRDQVNDICGQAVGNQAKLEMLEFVEEAYLTLTNPPAKTAELSPSYAKTVALNKNTSYLNNNIICSFSREVCLDPPDRVKLTLEGEPKTLADRIANYDPEICQIQSKRVLQEYPEKRKERFTLITQDLIERAFPELCKLMGDTLNTPTHFIIHTETFRRYVGVSEAGLREALDRCGQPYTALCLAIVIEKDLRNTGSIKNPGGYFRSLIRLGDDREQRIARTLHGLRDQKIQ